MRRIVDNDILTMLVRLVVGGTFIYASYYKVLDPADFARSIWYYHMVPGYLINLMALILPWLELICGVAIIVGWQYRGSLLLIIAMNVMFILALSCAIARGISIDCGCFKASKGATASAWQSLWFDVALMVLLAQLWLSRSKRWILSTGR
jgi:hypothetical protein